MEHNLRWSISRVYNAMPDLFDLMELPDGIDPELVVDSIMLDYGDLSCAHPLESMQACISVWSRRNKYKFAAWLQAEETEFNPAENYDRMEDSTDTGTGWVDSAAEATGKSAGYDGPALKVDSGSTSSSHSGSNNSLHRVSRIHGNIGVTTTTQMLADFRQFAAFDLYKQIANSFAAELLVAVYFN